MTVDPPFVAVYADIFHFVMVPGRHPAGKLERRIGWVRPEHQ
jgi:hypothetical protein